MKRYTICDLKKSMENEGYTLVSTEYSSVMKMGYICPQGHTSSVLPCNWFGGKRCPNWKGGISCEPYCQDWTKEYKEFIKERDGHQCLNPDCWGKDKRIHIHHIDYNKKNCDPSNLIALCGSCNSRANKDRKWHKSWYQAIITKRYDRS